jgi:hypothetical protein
MPRLLIGRGVAQSFDQEAAQVIVDDVRVSANVLHEIALVAANLVRPENRFESHILLEFAGQKAQQPGSHGFSVAETFGENAMDEYDCYMPWHLCFPLETPGTL